LHFLLLGSFLFGLQLWLQKEEEPGLEPIWIAEDRALGLQQAWAEMHGRVPTHEDLERILQSEVDDEILFRESLRSGLHLRDSVVRRRLDMNMEFVDIDGRLSPEERIRRAYELGMHETDLVVRRRLVQRAMIYLRDESRVPLPTPEEVTAFIEAHRDAFEAPRHVGFSHVYFANDLGEAKERAQKALERIRRERLSVERAQELGDPFGLPLDFPPLSFMGIGRRFGDVFAAEVLVAPAQAWSGPFSSELGEHLVWVGEVIDAELVDDDALRGRARRMLMDERKKANFEKTMTVLRKRYEVLIRGSNGEPIRLSALSAATVPAATVPTAPLEADR